MKTIKQKSNKKNDTQKSKVWMSRIPNVENTTNKTIIHIKIMQLRSQKSKNVFWNCCGLHSGHIAFCNCSSGLHSGHIDSTLRVWNQLWLAFWLHRVSQVRLWLAFWLHYVFWNCCGLHSGDIARCRCSSGLHSGCIDFFLKIARSMIHRILKLHCLRLMWFLEIIFADSYDYQNKALGIHVSDWSRSLEKPLSRQPMNRWR